MTKLISSYEITANGKLAARNALKALTPDELAALMTEFAPASVTTN